MRLSFLRLPVISLETFALLGCHKILFTPRREPDFKQNPNILLQTPPIDALITEILLWQKKNALHALFVKVYLLFQSLLITFLLKLKYDFPVFKFFFFISDNQSNLSIG